MTTPYADLQELNQTSGFIELYSLDTSVLGGSVYNFTNNITAGGTGLVFNSITYTPLPIMTDGWDFTAAGQTPKPTLTVSNVQKTLLAAVVSLGDLVGAKLTRLRTYEKYLDAGSFTQRNLVVYSEDLRNTAEAGGTRSWSQFDDTGNAVLVSYGHPALNGTNTASKLTANTTGAMQRQASQSFPAVAADGSVTHSIYAKAAECSYLKIIASTKTSPLNYPNINFNLNNGTIQTISSAGGFTPTGTITDAGNGWYRCSVTLSTVGSGGGGSVGVNIQLSTVTGAYFNAASVGDGLYLWGAQAEIGTALTDYQFKTTTHQPYADPSKYIGPDVYVIEQKTAHNKNIIQWQMTSIIDRMGMRIPRRQILKDKGFPGVSRTRIR